MYYTKMNEQYWLAIQVFIIGGKEAGMMILKWSCGAG
jgi:hypothetical protein